MNFFLLLIACFISLSCEDETRTDVEYHPDTYYCECKCSPPQILEYEMDYMQTKDGSTWLIFCQNSCPQPTSILSYPCLKLKKYD